MTPAVTPQAPTDSAFPPIAGGTQAAVTAPPVAQPEPVSEHHGFLSDLLHAVGDVFGGPKNVQRVNPQTGAIESVPASTRQRIAGGVASAVRGAAAGAAERGPGAVGRAALAGVQSADQARAIQQQALSRQSENVRQTNAAEMEKQQVQANLAKMSQDQARGALDLKIEGKKLDEHQTALANSMQEILNIPGAKLLQHFDSNDEINSHLETVGPLLSKQYAIDLAKNNIRLVQNPKGGFDAVEVPKTAGEQPIGEGKKLLTPIIDPKTNKLTLKSDTADPSMTWDKFQQWNGNSFSAYNAAQEQAQKIKDQEQQRLTAKAAATKDYAEAGKATIEGKVAAQNAGLDVNGGSLGTGATVSVPTANGATTGVNQEYLKTLAPGAQSLVTEIGTGKMALDRMTYLLSRNPGLAIQVARAFPDFDSSKVQSYSKTYNDFTSGKASTALNAGGTALSHLHELSNLNTVSSHIPGSPDYARYKNKAVTLATELAKFYGDSTIPAIQKIEDSLTSQLPGTRQAAIETQAQSMGDKFDSFEQQWKNAAPSAAYQAPMPNVTLRALQARAALDPAFKGRFATSTNPQTGERRMTTDGGQTWHPAPAQ
ncbi:MAG: hypothetical protein JWQ87_5449 [Candidatus Sulfotelmatobacter sp.]|nr:hypothetical protein [Candidatus Sulfotelmatobacter sp.]